MEGTAGIWKYSEVSGRSRLSATTKSEIWAASTNRCLQQSHAEVCSSVCMLSVTLRSIYMKNTRYTFKEMCLYIKGSKANYYCCLFGSVYFLCHPYVITLRPGLYLIQRLRVPPRNSVEGLTRSKTTPTSQQNLRVIYEASRTHFQRGDGRLGESFATLNCKVELMMYCSLTF